MISYDQFNAKYLCIKMQKTDVSISKKKEIYVCMYVYVQRNLYTNQKRHIHIALFHPTTLEATKLLKLSKKKKTPFQTINHYD